jgi:carbonic anhydrase/acetyltransferase-like protein (isoleucine patch superfamily)
MDEGKYGVFPEHVTVGHSVILHGCTIEDRSIGMGSIIRMGAHWRRTIIGGKR